MRSIEDIELAKEEVLAKLNREHAKEMDDLAAAKREIDTQLDRQLEAVNASADPLVALKEMHTSFLSGLQSIIDRL